VQSQARRCKQMSGRAGSSFPGGGERARSEAGRTASASLGGQLDGDAVVGERRAGGCDAGRGKGVPRPHDVAAAPLDAGPLPSSKIINGGRCFSKAAIFFFSRRRGRAGFDLAAERDHRRPQQRFITRLWVNAVARPLQSRSFRSRRGAVSLCEWQFVLQFAGACRVLSAFGLARGPGPQPTSSSSFGPAGSRPPHQGGPTDREGRAAGAGQRDNHQQIQPSAGQGGTRTGEPGGIVSPARGGGRNADSRTSHVGGQKRGLGNHSRPESSELADPSEGCDATCNLFSVGDRSNVVQKGGRGGGGGGVSFFDFFRAAARGQEGGGENAGSAGDQAGHR